MAAAAMEGPGGPAPLAVGPRIGEDGGDVVAASLLHRVPRPQRLVLVLDLDHTLLHTIDVHRLTPGEAYMLRLEPLRTLLAGRGGDDDRRRCCQGTHSQGEKSLLSNIMGGTQREGYLVRLRPFVRSFLREVHTMYDLRICTMGVRTYAHQMARILDPDGVYFAPGDIVSRLDYTVKGKKGLDVVRRGDERTTVILDDTPDVWDKHLANLIRIPEYHYFADTRRRLGFTGPSWAELGGDEDALTGALAFALHVLRYIHRAFFFEGVNPLATRDVRDILKGLLIRQRQEGAHVAGVAPCLRPPPQQQAHVLLQHHQLHACCRT